MNRYNTPPQTKQTGATLIVSLLILLVMTLLGVTAMQTNILEEKMSGNSQDVSLSLQAAEAAMREAEDYVETIVSPAAAFDGSTEWLYPDDTNVDVKADATWATARTYQTGDIANVTTRPKYIIELHGEIGSASTDVNISGYGESSGTANISGFRVTARGTGGSNETVTILQSYYAKAF